MAGMKVVVVQCDELPPSEVKYLGVVVNLPALVSTSR
jgi:hypothetical protein